MSGKSWEEMAREVLVEGNPAEVRGAALDWEEILRNVGQVRASLTQNVGDLGRTWKGPAYDAFKGHVDGLVKQIDGMVEAVSDPGAGRVGIVPTLETAAAQIEKAQADMPIPAACVGDVLAARNGELTLGVGFFETKVRADVLGSAPVEMLGQLGDWVTGWFSDQEADARRVYQALDGGVRETAGSAPRGGIDSIGDTPPALPPPPSLGGGGGGSGVGPMPSGGLGSPGTGGISGGGVPGGVGSVPGLGSADGYGGGSGLTGVGSGTHPDLGVGGGGYPSGDLGGFDPGTVGGHVPAAGGGVGTGGGYSTGLAGAAPLPTGSAGGLGGGLGGGVGLGGGAGAGAGLSGGGGLGGGAGAGLLAGGIGRPVNPGLPPMMGGGAAGAGRGGGGRGAGGRLGAGRVGAGGMGGGMAPGMGGAAGAGGRGAGRGAGAGRGVIGGAGAGTGRGGTGAAGVGPGAAGAGAGRGGGAAGRGAGGTGARGAGGRGGMAGMGAGGGAGYGEEELPRNSWLEEDEDVWGADGGGAPGVLR
ncbi:WXG100 family type VII secretion target [Micromonospora mirobrigensis]|uniref:Uncharacterized protein n=1 Tax=Micromonospora mirobrigensis TaxID=262898 RepID=A0A1C4V4V3_9ACTN|nr:hypothetical protein [Micromonospora mirobrigensis]SCE79023.1 hypothetical protein GA0070564_101957 [Micromonospora mirobrigensis]